MRSHQDLAAVRMIASLHAVQSEVAASEYNRATAALVAASSKTSGCIGLRDGALTVWQAALRNKRPDPHHLLLAGNWLVGEEAMLKSAQLDEAIALRHREEAATILAQRRAQEKVSEGLGTELNKRLEKNREERQALAAGEAYLRRRFV